MQVTMTMEEYEDLKYNIDKKIAEANEKHQTDLLYLGNKYKIELNKLRDENRKLREIIFKETGKEVV